jgi:segregation and condensation protein B
MGNSPQPLPTDPSPSQPSLSLDRLSQAFASMLGQEDARAPAAGESAPELSLAAVNLEEHSAADAASAAEGSSAAADAACEINPRTVLEAMLFVGRPDNQPFTSEQLAGLMRGVSAHEIDELIIEMNARYAAEERPYEVASEGAGYRLILRSQYVPLRDQYYGRLRRARLSQAAVEVLALVAYNEPVTADQVARLRGTPSGQILHHLVRRQLLRIERPATKPRKAKYFTTKRFLEVFRLRSLEDLPRSEELEAQ